MRQLEATGPTREVQSAEHSQSLDCSSSIRIMLTDVNLRPHVNMAVVSGIDNTRKSATIS